MSKTRKITYSNLGIKYFGKLLIKYLPLVLFVLAFAIIDSVTITYLPIFIQYIISKITNEASNINLPKFILTIFDSGKTSYMCVVYASFGLAIFQILRSFLDVIGAICRQLLGEKSSKYIRYQLYNHIQLLPYSYHANSDNGELVQRATHDIDVIKNFISLQIPQIISIIAVVAASLYQMYFINKTITFVSLIFMPIAFITSYFFCRYVSKEYEKIEEYEDELTSVIQENIENVRVVKSSNNEEYEIKRFAEKNIKYSKRNYHLNFVSAYYWGVNDSLTSIQFLLTCLIAIFIVKNNPTSIGIASFSTLLALISSSLWPIRNLGRIVTEGGKAIVSTGRIKEILDIKDEYEIDGKLCPEIKGNIEFNNVSFKFSDSNEYLLKNINFKIFNGETIAIVGKTGCGKSTIAKLMTRLLEVTDGNIYFDGISIKDINKKYLRKNIGLILQEPFLYARTVYENIAITNKNATKMQVTNASNIASITKDINSFSKGFDTIVGEKGVTLSGGQKQRIAIARMLLEDKKVLIFDDSLSAVDTTTDRLIRRALNERDNKCTNIIITHRISTTLQADRIIVIEDGRISNIGTHDELIKIPGFYQKLWNIQGNIELEFDKMIEEAKDE